MNHCGPWVTLRFEYIFEDGGEGPRAWQKRRAGPQSGATFAHNNVIVI